MRKAIAAGVLAGVLAATVTATVVKPIYKITRLSQSEVAISCMNGADPTTYPKFHGLDALIVSCGR